MSSSSPINGSAAFDSEFEKTITFGAPIAISDYTVHITSDLFADFRVTHKTVAGFTIEATATLSGIVGYDVFF